MKTQLKYDKQNTLCFHCGAKCQDERISIGDKKFCCSGCKTVFQILDENDLCDYYSLNSNPGVWQETAVRQDKFAFLDDKIIASRLIQFQDANQTHITLYLPQMHCSSCLWLLENLRKLNKGIETSRVNFTQKELYVQFNHHEITLRELVETLTSIGYEPHLSHFDLSKNGNKLHDRSRIYKLGVAGFCFANIMMMSLADYFAVSHTIEPKLKLFFSIASLLLSIPVLFYAASEFFVSAWRSLKQRYLNIDLPVALALVITFLRSLYEIANGNGNGYLDSMSGIVFFMLIGRWLQARSYQSISFDRDYRSFFPIAISVLKNNTIIPTPIENVEVNDVIQIHSQEIIPVDAILSKGIATIDYSFVTGESEANQINIGDLVYAGGKQLSGVIELIVTKEVSHSYLTNLWNNPIFHQEKEKPTSIYDTVGKYFTYFVLAVGLIAGSYWYTQGSYDAMWNAFTTVLIVACPCALLLASNFTNGNILRLFARHKFYLRSANIIEKLADINHIVLDKTGTITNANQTKVRYYGKILTAEQKQAIASLLYQSSHPLAKAIVTYINIEDIIPIKHYKDLKGKGLEGWMNETYFKIGSASFVGGQYQLQNKGTKVVVKIEADVVGEFVIISRYRVGITRLVQALKQRFTLSLLSGDNDHELEKVEQLLGVESEIYFNQSPEQKLQYISALQNKYQKNVLMVGDGLNDAGALQQSNVGVAVADSTNAFTPACDAIIDGQNLRDLNKFLDFARMSKKIILFTFLFSATYNFIGLYYAVQGILSPLIAALLMPSSSITIILLSYGLVKLLAKKYLNLQHNSSNKLNITPQKIEI